MKNGVPTVVVAAMFQKDPQALIAHPGQGYENFAALKNAPVALIAKDGQFSWWQWLKRRHGFRDEALRADPSVLIKNGRGQSNLWPYAISGDLPIVLLQVKDSANIELARQLVQAHAYWRLKGLVVDLVIWNEDHVGYRQRLQDQIMGLIATGSESHAIDRPGGIFVRSAEQISHEDRILLQSVARAIIDGTKGSLAEQVNFKGLAEKNVARLVPQKAIDVLIRGFAGFQATATLDARLVLVGDGPLADSLRALAFQLGLLAVACGVLAANMPARRAAAMDPAEAIRL